MWIALSILGCSEEPADDVATDPVEAADELDATGEWLGDCAGTVVYTGGSTTDGAYELALSLVDEDAVLDGDSLAGEMVYFPDSTYGNRRSRSPATSPADAGGPVIALLSGLALAAPYAVVVGADTPPPGRAALRYASTDARAVRDVLVEVGGHTDADVVLLLDPTPEEVLAAIAAAPPALDRFVLYYSGHADDAALFPRGRRLEVADLKRAIDAVDADVRLGVVDACRGGGWTGAKGVTAVEPFEVSLASAGTAYVAASSGAEDAHELEALGGSIFTHHWTSGLRGAADTDMDALVTLGESFDWARAHTVRDSSLLAGHPQHPSFHLDVHGRGDVVLADLRGRRSSVSLFWGAGSVELFALDTGLHVADLDQEPAVLVLPPGRYAARRTTEEGVDAAEFTVAAGEPVAVEPADFAPLGSPGLVASKGDELATVHRLAPYRGRLATQMSFGSWVGPADPGGELVRHLVFSDAFQVGLTDRLALGIPAPSLAYALGEHGRGLEAVVVGGFSTGGLAVLYDEGRTDTGLFGDLGGGLDLRGRLSDTVSVLASARASSIVTFDSGLDPFVLGAGVGLEWHLAPTVTVRPSLGLEQGLGVDDSGPLTSIGGALHRGVRDLPLLQVNLEDGVSLDLDFATTFDLAGDTRPVQLTQVGLTVISRPRPRKRDR